VDLLQLTGEAGGQVVERGREAAERRRDQADETPDQDVAARELGDRVDVRGRQRLTVHPAALELQQRVLGPAAEVAQRLGGRGRVAADERHRRRALQELLEPLGAGLLGRTLAQRVLDDTERGVGVAQLRAQLGGRWDGDAPVVDGVDRVGFLDLGGDLVDHRGFLVAVQAASCRGLLD
jgi:hypothetical protein